MTASVDSGAEIKSAPSVTYVTKSGRVWRKVPESDAWSVTLYIDVSSAKSDVKTDLAHPSL